MDPQAPPLEPVELGQQEQPAGDVRQQVVSHLQSSKSVLVTVKANPSVDELASALGLTFLLGKQGKHATAVFSGKIPSAMEFLDPEKVFENTVDSLRDFIIALDKEKADKLRYKVEDDVVKVFITPYRTVLSEKDLSFSQGDYNVDVVLALGVTQKEQLDKAILSHGKILHDATVVTITAGPSTSALGSLNWGDPEASSIAEMLVSLGEALGGEVLDEQISTALLTGLVAETNRFSNEKTTPRVMNIAAQLMAAGANQQLVATNLRQEGMISQPVRGKKEESPHDDSGEMVLNHDTKKQVSKKTGSEQLSPKTGKAKPGKKVESIQPSQQSKQAPSETEVNAAAQLKDTLAEAAPAQKAQTPPVTSEETTPFTPAVPQHKVVEPLPQDSVDSVPDDGLEELPSLTETVDTSVDQSAPVVADVSDTTTEDTSTEASVDDARKAVEMASEAMPAPATTEASVQTDPSVDNGLESAPETLPSVTFDQESPMDAFMKPQATPNVPADGYTFDAAPQPIGPPSPPAPAQASVPSANDFSNGGGMGDLPPLPPMPGDMNAVGMPPMPPLPSDPFGGSVIMQPQTQPEFLQGQAGGQNAWTQAGDELAAKRAEKEAANQARRDQLAANYDQAAQRQEELRRTQAENDKQAA